MKIGFECGFSSFYSHSLTHKVCVYGRGRCLQYFNQYNEGDGKERLNWFSQSKKDLSFHMLGLASLRFLSYGFEGLYKPYLKPLATPHNHVVCASRNALDRCSPGCRVHRSRSLRPCCPLRLCGGRELHACTLIKTT